MGSRQRFVSFNEAMNLLYELEENDDDDFDGADVVMEPPDVENSDEDSGDEDNAAISGFSGNQPQTNAAIRILGRSNTVQDEADLDDDVHGYGSNEHGSEPPRKKLNVQERSWIKSDLSHLQKDRWEWNEDLKRDIFTGAETPCNLFERFFDDDVIKNIVLQTKLFASQRGNLSFDVTTEEMRVFIAILIVSGYVTVPRRRMLWENYDDAKNIAVSNAMRRNKFDEIMRYLHFADNNSVNKEDKYTKVRNIMTMMNYRFLKYFPIQQGLCVDEAVIPYYGRVPCKQYIRGKPIKLGYKAWCLNCPDGYLVQFDFYQGKDVSKMSYLKDYGLGGTTVLHLIRELPSYPFIIAMGSYFTSLNLVDQMTNSGFAVVGAIKNNRIEGCPIENSDLMLKKERGSFDYRMDTSGVIVVRWKDNSIVTLVSNCAGVNPLSMAKRWSLSGKQRIEVPQPDVVKTYNKFRGGTNRMVENIGKYRIGIRGKRWWSPLFMFMIDAAIQNAWLLHRSIAKDETLDLLDFRRNIAQTYLRRFGVPPKSRAGMYSTKIDKRVSSEVRYDNVGHTIVINKTQLRCAQCPGKATRKCEKCNVGLHDKCFQQYHSR